MKLWILGLGSLLTMMDPTGEHLQPGRGAQPDAPIKITINPEERISVDFGYAPPQVEACGRVIDLQVRIVNQGFATARLKAQFVGDAPAGAALDFASEPLKGVPEELRHLRIVLPRSWTGDLTISFAIRGGIPDFGNQKQIHFLVSCRRMQ
jgi:hypothetical protein